METLTIKLPAEVKQRLVREARQAGKSVSAFIREAVTARLRKGTARGSLYDRTRDLCGAGGSGRPDLATSREILRGFGE
jgi:Arc/MetJ-type ribon-helix-helix transcriptional regulator